LSNDLLLLSFFLFALVACLYASVGHAGASGYLAIMALLNFTPEEIKPTSLLLNIVVASIASYQFIKAGHFDKKIFALFIISSIPTAYLGGYLHLPPAYFKLLAGIFLILSAILLLKKTVQQEQWQELKPMSNSQRVLWGGLIGFFSGLIGVGGGIFLSPLLIITRQASLKIVSGISALFILCNSIAAMAGHLTVVKNMHSQIFYWIPAVIVGGSIGSYLGTRKFNNKIILLCLFIVLLSAGLKFVLIDFKP
jgi:uncharacterized membrane protein YfcA